MIVPTVSDVYTYANKMQNSRIRHVFKRKYDYIQQPKTSGYRCLHLVYQFYSDTNETYNRNMLVELQFRTHLMHIWATAVETLSLFTKQALKAGAGDEHIKRFFVLVSSLFAIREQQPIVPGTIADIDELVAEIESINDRHHVLDMLNAIRAVINYKNDASPMRNGYYLLILNYETNKLQLAIFKPSEVERANTVYAQVENSAGNIDAVLVRAESLSSLKSAYPNYFGDINEFIQIVKSYLS